MIHKFCRRQTQTIGLYVSLAIPLVALCSSISPAQAAIPQTFDVKKYGATGNGSTDDSAAIARAIDAADNIPGSAVVFPTGTYFIGSEHPLLSAKSIKLEGRQNAVLSFGSSARIELTGTSPGIERLTINKNGSTSSNAVKIIKANKWFITDSRFSGSWFVDVLADGGDGNVFSNKFNTDQIGVQLIEQTKDDDVVFRGNTFTGTAQTAYFIIDQNGGGSLTVEHNTFKNGYVGVQGGGNGGTGQAYVTDNNFSNLTYGSDTNLFGLYEFKRNTATTVDFGTSSKACRTVTVDRNTIKNSHSAGIYVLSAFEKATISNNMVSNASGTQDSTFGINAQSCADATVDNNDVSGSETSTATYLIRGFHNENLKVTRNRLWSGVFAIWTSLNGNLTVSDNNITNIQRPGIVDIQTINDKIFNDNFLRNCMTRANNFDAMLFVNSVNTGAFRITNNTYTGRTGSAQYFIRVQGTSKELVMTGNQTTTTLPSFPVQE